MIRVKQLPNNVFLVMGATGVGKTSTLKYIDENFDQFVTYDLDAEIAKRCANAFEEVTDYFTRVGTTQFHQDSWDVIEAICAEYNGEKTILIDVGGGSLFGQKAAQFPRAYHCILLTADVDYLWATRQKCRDTHDSMDAFQMWQFDYKQMVYDLCKIKIDVGFLYIEEVACVLSDKVIHFKNMFRRG